nr:signal recognition particle-docking protein FtsY [Fulvimarina manganoxydans]
MGEQADHSDPSTDFSFLDAELPPEAESEEETQSDFSFLDAPGAPDDETDESDTKPAGAAKDGETALGDEPPRPQTEDRPGALSAEPADMRVDAADRQPIASETPQPVEPLDETRPETEPGVAPPIADESQSTLSDDAKEEEADFSWLDEDLPPEDEDEDEEDGATPAVTAAPRRPQVAGDAGFRLREEARPQPAGPAAPQLTWLQRLRAALGRSSTQLTGQITSIFTKRRLDEEVLQDFEDVLIQADLGVETAMRITDRLSEGRYGKEVSGAEVKRVLAEEIEKALDPVALPLELDLEKTPHVILVVGVNGTGKTTTIGKLAAKLTRAGLSVTLAAGDTFRAAAVEQLKIWGERTGSEVVARPIGADAAGLAFDAYDTAVKNGSDVLIIDTAGRLQNKAELMAELEKIIRVLQKREPDAPHTVLQTLDATTGQNAMNQVDIFRNVAGVNGLVMTKLDGTARGGILVAIAAKHRLPVYFVGVGEGIDDLEPFKARDFAAAIAGVEAEAISESA